MLHWEKSLDSPPTNHGRSSWTGSELIRFMFKFNFFLSFNLNRRSELFIYIMCNISHFPNRNILLIQNLFSFDKSFCDYSSTRNRNWAATSWHYLFNGNWKMTWRKDSFFLNVKTIWNARVSLLVWVILLCPWATNSQDEKLNIFFRYFQEKANLHNEKILKDIKATSGKRMSKEIANEMNLTLSTARSSFERIRSLALEQVIVQHLN